jgi:hypothetical protein
MLLGVSLALLLAGGVALAQALTMTVDQDCFECVPGSDDPDAEHTVVVTADDYSETELCGELRINGEVFLPSGECSVPPHEGPCEVWMAVSCRDMALRMKNDCTEAAAPAGLHEVGPSFTPVEYGDWVVKAWQEENGEPVGPVRFVGFRFAEDCAAEEVEAFVPEPGTIALLGSGLAGLAGYATLRWRSRK